MRFSTIEGSNLTPNAKKIEKLIINKSERSRKIALILLGKSEKYSKVKFIFNFFDYFLG